MNISEAYSILGVSEDISDEELKKIHRKLSFEFHPDKYKEDPNKLKTINEAHQLILDHRQNPAKYAPQQAQGFGFVDIGDIFSSFMGRTGANPQHRSQQPPSTSINISFRESVLGCQKTITYKRNSKCSECNGKGLEFLSNGCKECDGFGKKTTNRPGMTFQTQCNKCHGTNVKNKKCQVCNVKGYVEGEVSCSITVPAGVPNGVNMELPHAGHFQGNNGIFGDTYTSVNIKVNVEPIAGLELVGQDVVSKLNIPLVEALTGKKALVETIDGVKEISIPPLVQNRDEIDISGMGVAGKGKQRVVINVEYPKDVSKLIDSLKENV